MTQYIALDIETANLDMKSEGLVFGNPHGWKTACVCVYNSESNETLAYVHPDIVDEVEYVLTDFHTQDQPQMRVYSFNYLAYHLRRWRGEGKVLITHNGLGFDFPIMSKSIKEGGVGGCASLLKKWPPSQMIDMAYTLTEITKRRFRLQHLIHGLLGTDESKLMQAQFAPIEWDKGNFEEVLAYCEDDCRKTLGVYLAAKEQGEFIAIGGKDEYPVVSFQEFEDSRLECS